jgi:hypothetical protein
MLFEIPVLSLIAFMVLLLVLSLHALAAAGHFPHEHRPPALRSASGSLILFGSLAITLLCFLIDLVFAWQHIPWYAATISGGATVLVAPLLLQLFPDRFVDGAAALLTFASTGAVLTFFLIWITR